MCVSLLGFWDIISEWPYYYSWIQGLNIVLHSSESLFLVLSLVALMCEEFPLIVSFLSLLPGSVVSGLLLRKVGLKKARNAIVFVAETAKVDFNPVLLDVALREIYAITSMNFSFNHLYENSETCFLLSAILAASPNSLNSSVKLILFTFTTNQPAICFGKQTK